MTNPLLLNLPLPAFSKIKPEHVKPAVEQAIADCKKVIEQVLAEQVLLLGKILVMPIDEVDDILSKLWSPISHMNSVISSDELREAYESCLPTIIRIQHVCWSTPGLISSLLTVKNSSEFSSLEQTNKKLLLMRYVISNYQA